MSKPTLLVMAAGMGSRYGSLKQVDRFGPSGETIIDYSIYDAIRSGFGKVVFVIRESIEAEFKQLFYGKFSDKIAIDYALQELDRVPEGIKVPAGRQKPWGTGHAVLVAADKIREPFAVINADDYYGQQAFQIMADFLSQTGNEEHVLVGYRLRNTLSEHGYVSRGICEVDHEGYLSSVTERTHIYITPKQEVVYQTDEGKEVKLTGNEVASMNLMGFTPNVFAQFEASFKAFLQENLHHPKNEFYLPSVVNEIISSRQARVKVLNTTDHWFGVTYQEDKAIAQRKLKELADAGVYPENLWETKNIKSV
ncbi:nucleotidyltransferase family protein [Catalinimonas niigatensis]|uniref:nucleotidyltransferase family protein n=1 Tax=Catalinimonas niigatensis TaxID=1397264 RepID=UPI0026668ADE|nr:sugar phosphate nucleotidyltransferase [Catalinimonas niigatensis]WPP51486.1 sugar phosphate nucleotidyltransferase [Catalinimonas niigatensis]